MATPDGPHTPFPPRRRKRRLAPPTGAVAQDVLSTTRRTKISATPSVGTRDLPLLSNVLETVPERFYTVAEVAQRLRVTEKTVRNHIRDGRLRVSRVGRSVRIDDGALREYLGR